MLPAGVPISEAREFAVQGDGSKDPVKRKLIRLDQIGPVSGQGRNFDFRCNVNGMPGWRNW